jgi:hypothetical protein
MVVRHVVVNVQAATFWRFDFVAELVAFWPDISAAERAIH